MGFSPAQGSGGGSGPTTSDWSTVLGNGATTGGHNPKLSSGDALLAIDAGILQLGGTTVASDVAPAVTILQAQNALAAAATHTTGANTILAGSMGSRKITVNGYGSLSGKTLTVSVNDTAGVVLTEGVNWLAATSDNATATSLAAAINGNVTLAAQVTAVATGPVVYLTPKVGCYTLAFVPSDFTHLVGYFGIDGLVEVSGGGYVAGGANYNSPGLRFRTNYGNNFADSYSTLLAYGQGQLALCGDQGGVSPAISVTPDSFSSLRAFGSTGAGVTLGYDYYTTNEYEVSAYLGPLNLGTWSAHPVNFTTNGALRAEIDASANVVLNASGVALAQNATDGFTYVPTCATGAPSGTPTSFTGAAPVVVNGTNLYFYGGGAWQALSSSPSVLVGKITTYNNVATAGWGVPAIQSAGRANAQTSANSSIATYTVGAADGSFLISGNVLVTASATHTFSLECAYTDEGNTSRVVTFNVQQLGGTLVTAITNVTGAGPYEGLSLHIRCKASTSITIRTNAGGTYTSVTYNAEGSIRQIA